jgi:hypothetical protein
MPSLNLDWNIVMEIVLGVILYKIVDSLFDVGILLIKKAVATLTTTFKKPR